jgi:outer membrane biosynthesis protein TonB
MSNPDTTQPRRIHPLVATAAGAVIIASLAATAAITGVFTKATSGNAQNDQTQSAQVTSQPVVDSAQPANPAAYAQQQQPQAAQPTEAQQQAQAAQPTPAPTPDQQPYVQQQPVQTGQYAQQPAPQPAYCASCGTVVAISEVHQEGHGTGVGAVGGGFAGNSVEKHLRSTTAYSVHVRMESGKNRYFTYHEAPPFQQGERVHIENGTLAAG